MIVNMYKAIPVRFNSWTMTYEANCDDCGELVFSVDFALVQQDFYNPPFVVLHVACTAQEKLTIND